MWHQWLGQSNGNRNHKSTRRRTSAASRFGQRLGIELLEDRTAPAVDLLSISDPSLRDNASHGNSQRPSISSDGRFVAFHSDSANLVEADTNHAYDIFRKDLITGTIVRVSTSGNGIQGDGDSSEPTISNDGRYVAFHSRATNLVPGDTNAQLDVFRKDLITGAIVRVSVDGAGTQANSDSSQASISSNGQYVAFCSYASNLFAGDVNSAPDILRKNLDTGTVNCVSSDDFGAQGNAGSFGRASISGDGRYVAFASSASNLVPLDSYYSDDIFRKDLNTGNVIRASSDAAGIQANGGCNEPSMSTDGRYVAFSSYANNLVAGDTNHTTDVFRKDLNTGFIAPVSTDGFAPANGASYGPAISGDGRYVAFYSSATNLVAGATNYIQDVFRKDLTTGSIALVSTNAIGTPGNNTSTDVAIDGDGRFVAFQSYATNLVDGELPVAGSIFRKDVDSGVVLLASHNEDSGLIAVTGNAYSRFGRISADGRYVAFESSASNLAAGSNNGVVNIFRKDLALGITVGVSLSASQNYGNDSSMEPSISADGRYVAFWSYASNLVPGDTNGTADVFRKDLVTGVIVRVSTDSVGSQGNGGSSGPSISGNGQYVAFESGASVVSHSDGSLSQGQRISNAF